MSSQHIALKFVLYISCSFYLVGASVNPGNVNVEVPVQLQPKVTEHKNYRSYPGSEQYVNTGIGNDPQNLQAYVPFASQAHNEYQARPQGIPANNMSHLIRDQNINMNVNVVQPGSGDNRMDEEVRALAKKITYDVKCERRSKRRLRMRKIGRAIVIGGTVALGIYLIVECCNLLANLPPSASASMAAASYMAVPKYSELRRFNTLTTLAQHYYIVDYLKTGCLNNNGIILGISPMMQDTPRNLLRAQKRSHEFVDFISTNHNCIKDIPENELKTRIHELHSYIDTNFSTLANNQIERERFIARQRYQCVRRTPEDVLRITELKGEVPLTEADRKALSPIQSKISEIYGIVDFDLLTLGLLDQYDSADISIQSFNPEIQEHAKHSQYIAEVVAPAIFADSMLPTVFDRKLELFFNYEKTRNEHLTPTQIHIMELDCRRTNDQLSNGWRYEDIINLTLLYVNSNGRLAAHADSDNKERTEKPLLPKYPQSWTHSEPLSVHIFGVIAADVGTFPILHKHDEDDNE